VRAALNYIFGFDGWDDEYPSHGLVFEQTRVDGSRYDVCYWAKCRITIHGGCVHEGIGTGDAQNMPNRSKAHDTAIKDAFSDSIKRACINLGNQFGLTLYGENSNTTRSLAYPESEPELTSLNLPTATAWQGEKKSRP
jgi:recombination DNA repair RAD52 pathway protein